MIKISNTQKWREINKEYYNEYMKNYMFNYRKKDKIKIKMGCPRGKRRLHNDKCDFKIIKKSVIVEF